jgi:hypothetical protein
LRSDLPLPRFAGARLLPVIVFPGSDSQGCNRGDADSTAAALNFTSRFLRPRTSSTADDRTQGRSGESGRLRRSAMNWSNSALSFACRSRSRKSRNAAGARIGPPVASSARLGAHAVHPLVQTRDLALPLPADRTSEREGDSRRDQDGGDHEHGYLSSCAGLHRRLPCSVPHTPLRGDALADPLRGFPRPCRVAARRNTHQ